LIGTVELAVIALGRSIDMVTRARSLKGITVPVPTNITNSIQAVSEIGLPAPPGQGRTVRSAALVE
jgi:hypothetical protein